MEIRMIHDGRDRDSLLMPMDSRTIDLVLQYSIQLVRCEPTSHFNLAGTYCTGNGILHDEYGTFHLDRWTDAEWVAFRDNFVSVIMRYWDGKFELTPNRAWYQARHAIGAAAAASITCGQSLGLVDRRGSPSSATSSSSRRRGPSTHSPRRSVASASSRIAISCCIGTPGRPASAAYDTASATCRAGSCMSSDTR